MLDFLHLLLTGMHALARYTRQVMHRFGSLKVDESRNCTDEAIVLSVAALPNIAKVNRVDDLQHLKVQYMKLKVWQFTRYLLLRKSGGEHPPTSQTGRSILPYWMHEV